MKPLIGILFVAASISPLSAQDTTTRAATAPIASAQHTLAVQVGARIRVRSNPDSSWRVGRLAGAPPDSVQFQSCDACLIETYPLSTALVDISAGRQGSSSSLLKGAGLGLLAGIGAGILFAARAERGCRDGPCGISYTIAPALGGIAGFFVGATIGSLAGHEDWQPAPTR
jgi:hypothetical protein